MIKFKKEKYKKFLFNRKYFYYILLFLKNIYSLFIKYIRKIIFSKLLFGKYNINIFIYLFLLIK